MIRVAISGALVGAIFSAVMIAIMWPARGYVDWTAVAQVIAVGAMSVGTIGLFTAALLQLLLSAIRWASERV